MQEEGKEQYSTLVLPLIINWHNKFRIPPEKSGREIFSSLYLSDIYIINAAFSLALETLALGKFTVEGGGGNF